jgi:diguanylate cyclase (GGDEF)-like protein
LETLAARPRGEARRRSSHFGLSRKTGQSGLQRYESRGVAGLLDHPRRPTRSPNQMTPALAHPFLRSRSDPDLSAMTLAPPRERIRRSSVILGAVLEAQLAEERRRGRLSRSGTAVLDNPLAVDGSQQGRSEAYIVLIHPAEMEIGRRIQLEGERYTLGRDPDCAVPLERDSVSRQHASLVRGEGGRWRVRDLGSTNGTRVNEQLIEGEVHLKDGDQIRLGDVVFKFLIGSNVENLYHQEVYQLSVLDGLTGIHNKRYFVDFLERELASAHRHRNPLTLVMFDIDHFKPLNDERGHLGGDAVLKQLAERIRPRIRREDLFARYGGEEFVVILTITKLEGGIRFAQNIRQMIARRPFSFEGTQIPLTISLGVTTMFDEPKVDAEALIRRADERLYEAKRAGRNRVAPALAESR